MRNEAVVVTAVTGSNRSPPYIGPATVLISPNTLDLRRLFLLFPGGDQSLITSELDELSTEPRRRLAAFGIGLALSLAAAAPPAVAQDVSPQRAEFLSLYQQLLKNPTNVELTLRYARLGADLGDYEASVSALERLLMYNPNLPTAEIELGLLYARLKSYAMAKVVSGAGVRGARTPVPTARAGTGRDRQGGPLELAASVRRTGRARRPVPERRQPGAGRGDAGAAGLHAADPFRCASKATATCS